MRTPLIFWKKFQAAVNAATVRDHAIVLPRTGGAGPITSATAFSRDVD